MDFYLDRMYRN